MDKKIKFGIKSIKFKLFFMVTMLIAAVVAVCVILNSAFAQKFYISKVKNTLVGAYTKTCGIYSDNTFSKDEKANEIEKICNNSNMHIMIFKGREILYSSLPQNSARFFFGMRDRTKKLSQENEGSTAENPEKGFYPQNRAAAPIEGSDCRPPYPSEENRRGDERTLLEETKNYKILSSYISALDAYNMELMGTYDENVGIVIQSSVAAISENVSVSNSFLIFLGIIALLLAAFFAYVISKRITDPIHGLSEIAKSMSELDFSKKYTDKKADEVGLLGESINTLSEKLEASITELKNANLKLLKDIDKKEKIDRQRREFLSNVSHELKTPIAIIEAYADGLCEIEQTAEERKAYTEVILDEAEKMSMLIKKMTSLMQLESESERVELKCYDINSRLREITDEKQLLASQYNAKLTYEETGECFVWADEFLIEEAVVNYIVNAFKYGTGIIKIFTEKISDRGKKLLRVCVYNSGNEIKKEESERIWESFYRSDKARSRAQGSSGLGLSVVKAIANAHGMECGMYNKDDGVVFYIEVELK